MMVQLLIRRRRSRNVTPSTGYVREGPLQLSAPPNPGYVFDSWSANAPGGLVQIVATRVDDDVLVSVEDEGPGVPEAERETIFRRFHSVRPNGEQFGKHSGLGLAIARSILEGHQGAISISDRDDSLHGARFEVHLPAASPLADDEAMA